ncbi:hypothetical protein Nepgr_001361 [Nepenthes gracilis]|uniref:BZIP domain-containing protein n=1 Tax=Nepenthes gracilis TaxID=150966 RepID=A0AAD3RW10_NEPGR|nr:hypothetical protein Nepgr_001361 [Nepenthes gracilis]
MGIQTMGSQGISGSDTGKHLQLCPLARQNSMYSLTLDEVQNQLGDLGKPLSSMNLDELLKSVEANQSMCMESMDLQATAPANHSTLQHQTSLSLTGSLSKKTVDEVWRDIQQGQNVNLEETVRERQTTLGEMTLEDFLVKAGVVTERSLDKRSEEHVASVEPGSAPQFPQQGQWMQYQQTQLQHPLQNMMGISMPGQQPIPQPMSLAAVSIMDVSYTENQVPLLSPLMGTLSETRISGRKRIGPEDIVDKSVERRQKRMIKNRESAARSRARKQAYTNELQNKVSRLEEENKRLRKRKELEEMLPCLPHPEPKYQLRRTSSAPL